MAFGPGRGARRLLLDAALWAPAGPTVHCAALRSLQAALLGPAPGTKGPGEEEDGAPLGSGGGLAREEGGPRCI